MRYLCRSTWTQKTEKPCQCAIGNILEDKKYSRRPKVLCLKSWHASLPPLHQLEKGPVLIGCKGYHHIVNNQFPLRVQLGLIWKPSAAISVACSKAYSRQPIQGNVVAAAVEGTCYVSTLLYRQHRSVVCQSRSKRLMLEKNTDPKKHSECRVNFSTNNSTQRQAKLVFFQGGDKSYAHNSPVWELSAWCSQHWAFSLSWGGKLRFPKTSRCIMYVSNNLNENNL